MKQLTHPRVALLLFLLGLLIPCPGPVQAQERLPSTAGITKEVQRASSQNQRLINFWWLPQEYWQAAARERKMSPTEIEEVGRVFRDYLFVAAIEASVGADGMPSFAKIAEIVKQSRFKRNGEELEVLRQVNPRIAELAPKLIYSLRASLAMLGQGLVLLPMANVDRTGKPILQGSHSGELVVEFDPGDGEKIDFRWRGPLTALVGARACPKGGEPLEANWDYCPWHGVKAVPPQPADAKN